MQTGIAGARLLEIGCGAWVICTSSCYSDGAQRTLGVDISEEMLRTSKRTRARAAGWRIAEYRQGDFVEIADGVAGADVTLLDKVVCSTRTRETLVTKSLAKTRRVYALTYPRDHVLNRVGVRVLGIFFYGLCVPTFRSYVHDPRRIEGWIAVAGFKNATRTRLLSG